VGKPPGRVGGRDHERRRRVAGRVAGVERQVGRPRLEQAEEGRDHLD